MPAFIDLSAPPHGPHFGAWTVLRYAGRSRWVCRCDPDRGGCGRESVVRGQELREGRSTRCRSCAGLGRQNRPPRYAPGERVPGTRWTVRRYRRVDRTYSCVCECGRVGIVQVGNLANGTSTQCPECREAVRHGRLAPVAPAGGG